MSKFHTNMTKVVLFISLNVISISDKYRLSTLQSGHDYIYGFYGLMIEPQPNPFDI